MPDKSENLWSKSVTEHDHPFALPPGIFKSADPDAIAAALQHSAEDPKRGSHDAYNETVHAVEDFSPERVYSGREELGCLLTGLRELPERTRNVFLLARLENMKQAEIARRLGVSVSGVEKHLARAIAHLSQRLGRVP